MTLINTTVLMSDAKHFSTNQAINPYYSPSPLDDTRAQQEHDAIRHALRDAGVTVLTVPSPASSQDGVYTANWALVRGKKAVLARLPTVRRSEEAYARKVLTERGYTVISVPDGLHFSGQGDALACGQYLICGKGYRSDEAAQKFAADALGYTRVQIEALPQVDADGTPQLNTVTGWPDSFFYDIDLAVSIITAPTPARTPSDEDTDEDEGEGEGEPARPGLIVYCPEALTPESVRALESLPDVDTIHVSLFEAKERFACNLVSTGETVVMGDGAPELKKNLEAHGLTVITPHIEELAKGGGYVRCTSLTLD